MSLGYFQKQQKADPPLECRGRCSSSSCTACLENNSRSYVINSESPLVNIKTNQRSRVGTRPTSSYGQCEETALHPPQSLLQESLKENSLAEKKFPTVQKETTYFMLQKKEKIKKLPKKMRHKNLSTCPVSISQLQWKGFLVRAE